MTTLQERVRAHFEESIAAKRQTVEVLAAPTAEAAMKSSSAATAAPRPTRNTSPPN